MRFYPTALSTFDLNFELLQVFPNKGKLRDSIVRQWRCEVPCTHHHHLNLSLVRFKLVETMGSDKENLNLMWTGNSVKFSAVYHFGLFSAHKADIMIIGMALKLKPLAIFIIV